MKKLNRKFIKGTNWALAGLMSFLGFSSCEKARMDMYGTPAEYGTPHAEYAILGRVTDADGNALEGIRVAVADHNPFNSIEINDTLYTKENGSFEYSHFGFPTKDSINIKMKFEDVSEKVSFETDSTTVTFLNPELQGGKGWFEGKAEKEVNIKLRRKESE